MFPRRILSAPMLKQSTRAFHSVTVEEASSYSVSECTALLGSMWIMPIVIAFVGGVALINRSDRLEAAARNTSSAIKILSPDAYRRWRSKDPARMELQLAKESPANVDMKAFVHNPPNTYGRYRPTISGSNEKPKKS